MASLCIHNARLVTAAAERRGGVLVGDDGRIEAILDAGRRAAADLVIDAKERLLLPGFVDAHVHMRDPGFTHKEDFASGADAAACGGVTTVMCMPNTRPPIDGLAGFEAARAAGAARSAVDFTLQAAATRRNRGDLAALWDAGVTSFEGFLSDAAEDDRLDDPAILHDVLHEVARLGAVIGLYTGVQARIDEAARRLRAAGRRDWRAFAEARSAAGEAEGIAAALDLARRTGARVVFRQVSGAPAFRLLRQARRSGARAIGVEATPHHLHLDDAVLDRLGPVAQMIPPLRPAADRDAALRALADGDVDFIGSDHAPHAPDEKAGDDAWGVPGGTAGLDTIAAATADLACRGAIPWTRVADLLAARPARIFGIADRKGDLRAGLDGDLTLVDPTLEREVRPDMLRSRAGRSVFEGARLRGWPVLTILRGRVIAENGTPAGGEPGGRFLPRAP